MRSHRCQLAFVFACALSACSSTPQVDPDKDAYWADPSWDESLFHAIQSAVYNPFDTGVQSAESIHGKVQFTLVGGTIHDAEMMESTGRPDLDTVLQQQLETVSVPKPTGPRAAEAHAFELELYLPTAFESAEYAAIDRWRQYPKEALMQGAQGSATVGFDYLDGKVSNVAIAKSSRNKSLDDTSKWTISKASFPPPPSGYAGKSVRLQVVICYSLNNSDVCPTTGYVIHVMGWRIRTVTYGH